MNPNILKKLNLNTLYSLSAKLYDNDLSLEDFTGLNFAESELFKRYN
jgi:hypothetical protein